MPKISQRINAGSVNLFVAESGQGPAVLFLHGLGWDHHLWDGAFDRYGDRWRVIAGDTRGHGQSDQPNQPYSIGQFAEDWLGVLDQLGIESTALVGFSQGGMIAMEMVTRQPERFSRVILCCTICRTPAEVSENMTERIQKLEDLGALESAKLASQSVFSPEFIAGNPQTIETFIQQRSSANQIALRRATEAIIGFDVCDRLSSLSLPCTVIAAEQDTLTTPEAVRRVHDHIPGSQFICIPQSGHMIPIERPEVFYTHLDQALKGIDTLSGRSQT